jgi:hypothetical protein
MSAFAPPASPRAHDALPLDTDSPGLYGPNPRLDGATPRPLRLSVAAGGQATAWKWLSRASEMDSGVMSQLSRS